MLMLVFSFTEVTAKQDEIIIMILMFNVIYLIIIRHCLSIFLTFFHSFCIYNLMIISIRYNFI